MLAFLIAVAVLAGFSLMSVIALYSFGRFAERVQGVPSVALMPSAPATPLDELIEPLVSERQGKTGLILLDDNLDAFAIRALSARHAGRSLDLQYYIWKSDLTGRLLVNELLKAADRGVRVRLLLDDLNAQGHDRSHLALDAHPNIAVRLFNPSRNREGALGRGIEMALRALRITRRMHNKAWIADGRLAVIGGRNVGDAYFDAAATANFRDLDLLVLGTALREAEAVFDTYWNSKAVIPISALGEADAADLARFRADLAAAVTAEHSGPYLDHVSESTSVGKMLSNKGRIHWTTTARIVSDPPEKVIGVGEENWLIKVVGSLLASASTDLQIISPYFIPGDAGTQRLVGMAERGIGIAILTNSLAATDVVAVHGAYARYRKPLVAAGICLFELKPYDNRSRRSLFGSNGASLHTKAFTIDGRTGFVGSMNLDPRSISLNSEMGVVFDHGELADEVRTIFARQCSGRNSYRVGIEGSKVIWQDESGDALLTLRDEPESGFWRRLMAKVIGCLPIESQL